MGIRSSSRVEIDAGVTLTGKGEDPGIGDDGGNGDVIANVCCIFLLRFLSG